MSPRYVGGILSRYSIGLLLYSILVSGCDSGPNSEVSPPSTPRLSSPFDRSENQENAVYLEWKESFGADRYQVQVSTNTNFNVLQFEQEDQSSPIIAVADLQIGTTYYWRIRAYNDTGSSNWSAPWSFKPSSLARVPDVPQLFYPANEQTELPSKIVFKWKTAESARFYHIQASQSADFYNLEADMNMLADSTQSVTQLIHGYTYFWRVRARNAAGFSSWSPVWYIIIADFD